MIPLPFAFLFLCVARRMEGQPGPPWPESTCVIVEFPPRGGSEPELNDRPRIPLYLHEDQSVRPYPPLNLRQAPQHSAVDQSRFAGNELAPSSQSHGNTFSRPVFSYASELRDDFLNVPFPNSDDENENGIRNSLTIWLQGLISQGTYSSHLVSKLDDVNRYYVPETTEYLVKIREFIHVEMPECERVIQRKSQQIAEILRYAVAKPSVNRLAPLADLANRLADFNKRDLDASRSAIRSYSDSGVNFLADLHGLLGPGNVFETPLTTLLGSIAIRFPDGSPHPFDLLRLVKELKKLQMHLTKLAEYLRGPDNNRAGSQVSPDASIDAIRNFGKKYDQMLGRTAFRELMLKTTQSDFYKALQFELDDIAGYELQLVQLPGDAQTLKNVLPTAPGGVVFTPRDDLLNSALQQLRKLALQNTEKRLHIATRAWHLKQKLLRKSTPTGLSSLSRLDWNIPATDFTIA
ncbi:hypothetical protein PTTG_29730 [Puccinia triticina 1-1 BBBD Race 1]|uniref:Uncharacterized protein n=1 Tax=Puccinia triticina (isolate 1-1 / race 1 (BBBD)) TaxID=630390 RepID=A0A180G2H7_PUCT1|nr:hypothetical protein PTTG_29730 [Puccinia triticina 1-1 BBBD Race 1]WAR59119.1 hypothetical protein PtB15_10B461 [Puccinia triticina]